MVVWCPGSHGLEPCTGRDIPRGTAGPASRGTGRDNHSKCMRERDGSGTEKKFAGRERDKFLGFFAGAGRERDDMIKISPAAVPP